MKFHLFLELGNQNLINYYWMILTLESHCGTFAQKLSRHENLEFPDLSPILLDNAGYR